MKRLILIPLAALAACNPPPELKPAPKPEPEPEPELSYHERYEQCKLLDHERRSIYVQFVRLSDMHGEDVARRGSAEGHKITTECLDKIVINAMLDNPEWTPMP